MIPNRRSRRLKLEAFWRAHLKGWRDSNLNQRKYCELHGLPQKRFGNWRAEFKHEETIVPEGLLCGAVVVISLGLCLGVGKFILRRGTVGVTTRIPTRSASSKRHRVRTHRSRASLASTASRPV